MNNKIRLALRNHQIGNLYKSELYLKPLTMIHLHSHVQSELGSNGDIKNIYIFSAVALFVSIIACINFMNLATARSADRAREVGVRKVAGAQRSSLINQFLGEAILTVILSVFLAVALTELLLPEFNSIVNRNLKIDYLNNWSFSLSLIIGTVIFIQQVNFLLNKDLGFNSDHILIIHAKNTTPAKNKLFRNLILQHPNVIKVGVSDYLPYYSSNWTGFSWEGAADNEGIKVNINYTDENALDTYGMTIAKGRGFSKNHLSDQDQVVILNEEAVRKMGLDESIGKRIYYGVDYRSRDWKGATIVGIVKDFHFLSLHETISPLMLRFYFKKMTGNNISVKIAFADPSFFYVFDHKFIHGDPKRCLKDPGNIVLTESLARKYFGHDDPIGNFIKVENEHLAEVTGVIEDLPRNSHLPLHGLISFSTIAEIYPDQNFLDWPMFELAGYTYLLVDKTFTLQKFSQKFPAFYDKYITEDGKFYKQVFEPILQKLTDIHYGTSIRGDYPLGNKVYIYAFFSVGILILALACINYINFATVQSAVRAKEIGVKKALGANRRTLILQTLTESLLSAFAALIIAFALVELIIHLPPFNELLNVELQHELINNPLLIVGSIAMFIIIGILSGIYPAFYLSSIPPANALFGNLRSGKQGLFIRSSLVVLQFIISITVVVVTLLMNDQINFMRNKDLGFKKENVVSIRLRDEDVIQSVPAIREELLKNPDIISVTTGNNRPGKPSTGLYRFEGQNGMEEHNFWVFWVESISRFF